jgi:hypothetical protein
MDTYCLQIVKHSRLTISILQIVNHLGLFESLLRRCLRNKPPLQRNSAPDQAEDSVKDSRNIFCGSEVNRHDGVVNISAARR